MFILLLWKLIGILKDLTLKKVQPGDPMYLCSVPKLPMQSTKQTFLPVQEEFLKILLQRILYIK